MGLDHRNIKPKNSGIILRFLAGYHNALSMGNLNRVFFNDDILKQMPIEHKKFLIAHELTHQYIGNAVKLLASKILTNTYAQFRPRLYITIYAQLIHHKNIAISLIGKYLNGSLFPIITIIPLSHGKLFFMILMWHYLLVLQH